jgi:Fe-Mn family superoxide dismutase
MQILPELPYALDALAPFVSSETLEAHHGKHHKTYVDKTNQLATKAALSGLRLEDIVRRAHSTGDIPLFNAAAQAWNHAFFWQCMRPPEKAGPASGLLRAINQAFGSLQGLRTAFVETGVAHFGSGWNWIVAGPDGLKVVSTHDADDLLIREGVTPLLVCDLWEHAYYLDYKNERQRFLERWFDNLANWDFADAQWAVVDAEGPGFRYPLPVSATA